ncbi:MAG: YqgE/AlgH family protein [Desulfobacterales bacterium]|nr:YqgE/AlgH family protein [Desulfobacterales bacterium]
MIQTLGQGTLKGMFLIATPSLLDPNFKKTVICICEQTKEGAIGLVINRVHKLISAKDLFDELHIKYKINAREIPIYIGGPVHIGEVFVLHGPPFGWKGCFMISNSIALSNTRDVLEAIALDSGPTSYLIAIGCSGWGTNQLENELMDNSWLTCPIYKSVIYEVDAPQRWNETVRIMGIDPARLSVMAGHA